MAYSVQHKGDMIAFTDAEGLHKIRQSCTKYGYTIVKIEEPEGKAGYVVTMKKIKKLVKYEGKASDD